MGSGSSSINIYKLEPNMVDWKKSLSDIQLNETDALQFRKLLCKIKKTSNIDEASPLPIRALLDYYECQLTSFMYKLFSPFKSTAEPNGVIDDLREFIFSLWNICTMDENFLPLFIFKLYKTKPLNKLSSKNIIQLTKDVYGTEYKNNATALSLISKLENTNALEYYDENSLASYLKSNPYTVAPILAAQTLFEKKSFTPNVWKDYKAKRVVMTSQKVFEVYADINAEIFGVIEEEDVDASDRNRIASRYTNGNKGNNNMRNASIRSGSSMNMRSCRMVGEPSMKRISASREPHGIPGSGTPLRGSIIESFETQRSPINQMMHRGPSRAASPLCNDRPTITTTNINDNMQESGTFLRSKSVDQPVISIPVPTSTVTTTTPNSLNASSPRTVNSNHSSQNLSTEEKAAIVTSTSTLEMVQASNPSGYTDSEASKIVTTTVPTSTSALTPHNPATSALGHYLDNARRNSVGGGHVDQAGNHVNGFGSHNIPVGGHVRRMSNMATGTTVLHMSIKEEELTSERSTSDRVKTVQTSAPFVSV